MSIPVTVAWLVSSIHISSEPSLDDEVEALTSFISIQCSSLAVMLQFDDEFGAPVSSYMVVLIYGPVAFR